MAAEAAAKEKADKEHLEKENREKEKAEKEKADKELAAKADVSWWELPLPMLDCLVSAVLPGPQLLPPG